jgi:hypothetical protein
MVRKEADVNTRLFKTRDGDNDNNDNSNDANDNDNNDNKLLMFC